MGVPGLCTLEVGELSAMEGSPAVLGPEVAVIPAGKEKRTLIGEGIVALLLLRPANVCRLLPPIAGDLVAVMG